VKMAYRQMFVVALNGSRGLCVWRERNPMNFYEEVAYPPIGDLHMASKKSKQFNAASTNQTCRADKRLDKRNRVAWNV
jgi:hypothetical protein